MIYNILQQAIEADSHKKGIVLYRIEQGGERQGWVWARTSQEALSKVARDLGITATRHVSGVNINSGGFDGVS